MMLPSHCTLLKTPVLLVLFSVLPLHTERTEDIRAQLSYLTTALSNSNPSDALSVFDKSTRDYEKMRDYFVALTQSYDITSEITVKDEDAHETDTKLIVDWRLTLEDRSTSFSSQRSADIHLTFAQRQGKWKIVDLSPADFFNAQRAKP